MLLRDIRIFRALLIALLPLAIPAAVVILEDTLLVVDAPMARADAIIVLGGEPESRPAAAAKLYREGVAPLLFVTGIGDNGTIRDVLLQSGVPASSIRVEANSSSTLQNADFSRPLLEKAGIRRALIVTSPFHSRRALATFQQRIPGVAFGVLGTRRAWWDTPRGRVDEMTYAVQETWKIPAYLLLYGVVPRVSTGSSGLDAAPL